MATKRAGAKTGRASPRYHRFIAIITQTCTLNLGNVKSDRVRALGFTAFLRVTDRRAIGLTVSWNYLAQAFQIADALGAGGLQLPGDGADQCLGDDKKGGG